MSADQRVRFLGVGAINTLLGYLCFAAFSTFFFAPVPFGYLISLILSYAIAIGFAFVLYRRFVFKVTGHIVRDLLRFVSVYALSIGLNLLLLPLGVELLRIHPLVAQLVIVVLTTIISFVGHRRFSFRRVGGDPAPVVPLASDPEQPEERQP